ncbi:hypothetical protein [uncultured Clostridium sp.]|uniref:hypothetical protein n=1 Tax=uncultured Clostridium sp. TaxID=59620 RepID=UPI0025D6F18C|nr:hypothetical protein [uncultured Clostridium sp.]
MITALPLKMNYCYRPFIIIILKWKIDIYGQFMDTDYAVFQFYENGEWYYINNK